MFCRRKLVDEETPSGLTSSVVLGDLRPPISNMVPPSEAQHRWRLLSSAKLTLASLQDPVIGSSLMQDRPAPNPPQRSPGLPQCVWPDLSSGRSGRRQEWWVWGLNTSTLLPTEPLGQPPVIIIPRNKCIYDFLVYNIQWQHTCRAYFLMIKSANYINSPLVVCLRPNQRPTEIAKIKMTMIARETKMRDVVMTESHQALKLSNSKVRIKTTCALIDNCVDNNMGVINRYQLY